MSIWPVLIWLLLNATCIGFSLAAPKVRDPWERAGQLIGFAINFGLLYWGGFFQVLFR